jgi:hypothetical protein
MLREPAARSRRVTKSARGMDSAPLGLPSGADLTFAVYLAASWSSECQILNSTRILISILSLANVPAAMGREC